MGSVGIELIIRDSMTGEVMVMDCKSGDTLDKDALNKLGQARVIPRDWAVMPRDQADLQRASTE